MFSHDINYYLKSLRTETEILVKPQFLIYFLVKTETMMKNDK